MNKRQILMLMLAGIISFASVFVVGLFVNRKSATAAAEAASSQQDQTERPSDVTDLNNLHFRVAAGQNRMAGMTERQLQNLMQDIRNKAKEYKERQKTLDDKAERIEISSQSLQEDIDRLNELRDKLSQTLLEIDQKQQQLEQSIIEIQQIEQDNFRRLASTYEKMDSTQASRIMVNMASSNQLQDSVKILYYMNERMAGKLLGEIATNRPELASLICMQLKRIKEGT